MTAPLFQIAERLKKLMLLLSSDKDGEVVNAARAIGRALHTAGADWHDFAGLVDAPASTKTHAGKANTGKANTSGNTDNTGNANTGNANWRAMLEYCLRNSTPLSSREQDFINSLGRWGGEPTPKQLAWLQSIYARLQFRNKEARA
jgi:hypothetical protein